MSACDAGKQHNQQTLGPLVRVLGSNVDPDTGTIPADGVLQISFDRYLLPSTITRQSYVVLDASNQVIGGVPFRTIYDPVARVVTIAGPDGPGKAWLTPDRSYKVVLLVATDPTTDVGGFRAIDRSPLLADQKTRDIVFRAGPATESTQFEPAADFCADVFPIFAAKCSSPGCHGTLGGQKPAASLILGTANGVRVTAVGRVAQGANTSARSYTPEPGGRLFGVNMAIIQPGDPGSSWLTYKLELAQEPTIVNDIPKSFTCTPPAGAASIPAPAGSFIPIASAQKKGPDEIERAILSDFILGREMPYPAFGAGDYTTSPLTFQQREKIRIWIARGAETRECGGCAEVSFPDAGATDDSGTSGTTTDGGSAPTDAAADAADAGQ